MLAKRSVALAALISALALSTSAGAASFPFSTTEIGEFLIIGTGPSSAAVGGAISNFEIGANQAPVPVTSAYGPGLAGNVPALPSGIKSIPTGVLNNGEVAITNSAGTFDFGNVGVYASTGVQCAGTATASSTGGCIAGTSNTAFNQPGYPNDSSGTFNSFDSNFQLEAGNGVTGNVDFTSLRNDLGDARNFIANATATTQIRLVDGKISNDLTTTLVSGLNVIDIISTDGSDVDVTKDILLENSNWVINGPDDAYAIFRIQDDEIFDIKNSNILAGEDLGGLDRIIFASLNDDNGQHFKFNQVIVNGVAFWTLFGTDGNPNTIGDFGEIVMNDVQGCTQLVGAKINLNDVRLTRCADSPSGGPAVVPIPAAAPLFGSAIGLLGFLGWRKRRREAA